MLSYTESFVEQAIQFVATFLICWFFTSAGAALFISLTLLVAPFVIGAAMIGLGFAYVGIRTWFQSTRSAEAQLVE